MVKPDYEQEKRRIPKVNVKMLGQALREVRVSEDVDEALAAALWLEALAEEFVGRMLFTRMQQIMRLPPAEREAEMVKYRETLSAASRRKYEEMGTR